jgi:hypothetical protein
MEIMESPNKREMNTTNRIYRSRYLKGMVLFTAQFPKAIFHLSGLPGNQESDFQAAFRFFPSNTNAIQHMWNRGFRG